MTAHRNRTDLGLCCPYLLSERCSMFTKANFTASSCRQRKPETCIGLKQGCPPASTTHATNTTETTKATRVFARASKHLIPFTVYVGESYCRLFLPRFSGRWTITRDHRRPEPHQVQCLVEALLRSAPLASETLMCLTQAFAMSEWDIASDQNQLTL